jgi:acetylornithine deacetylase
MTGNHINKAAKLLREMVGIPSETFSEEKVCNHICSWLEAEGFEFIRKGNNIICHHSKHDPQKKTLMMCAHIDTVSPTEGYSLNPYTAEASQAAEVISKLRGESLDTDEVIYGLGSNDDGGCVVAMLAVLMHLRSSELPMNLVVVLSCEEERSGPDGMSGLWDELKDEVDFAIVGEPTCMKAATSERGLLVIDGLAEGVSGHAARNEGVNALYIAIEDIEKIRSHKFEKISALMGEVNVNVTQINAGSAHNVIPDSCSFVIDIRPTEQYSNEEIWQELQSFCRSRLTPRNLKNASSASREGSPLLETAAELGIETFSSPTTSDWMRISCDAVKMGPGDSSRSHRKDEYVLKSEIAEGVKTYLKFIEKLGEKVIIKA